MQAATATTAIPLDNLEVRRARAEAKRLSNVVLVDGRLVEAIAQDTFPIENPAYLETIAHVPRCRAADVDRAVQSAQRAFPAWAAMPARERGRRLTRIVERLEEESDAIARLMCLETGNALSTQARPETAVAIDMLRLFAGLASELKGRTIPWSDDTLVYTTRDPLGVVGAIIPWNAPLSLTACKLGPALVAGNTVVLKTAEQAPLAVLRFIDLMQEELPPGVANCISGFGEEAGQPLAEHPLVRKISFTGSTAVGKLIMGCAAEKLVPVTLELGGKSPNIVLPDADLDLVVPGIMSGMRFTRQGQSCSAGSRLFLHERVCDEVVERLVAEVGKLRMGDPMDEASDVGTIISREQLDRVTHYVELAKGTRGVKIHCGGGRPDDRSLPPGYFFAPTLIEGEPHDSPVCRDEIFGPVACIFRWNDFDAMLDLANDTDYGLAASLWTRDLNRALSFAKRIQAGFVQVNQYITTRPNLSYGGLKSSGLGRENTLESMLEHFTSSKTVMINQGTPGV